MRRSIEILLLLLLLSGCSTTSEGRRQLTLVSSARIDREGTEAFERLKTNSVVVGSKSEKAYLYCVLSRLKPSFSTVTGLPTDWEVVIFKSEEANAFALPGKKIGVNSGLLRVAVNADQLATVLAHEIAHVEAQHGRERTSQQVALESIEVVSARFDRHDRTKVVAGSLAAAGGLVQLGLLYPFSKVQEEEADLIGLELMAEAGFDPEEALHFWENMQVYGTSGSDSLLSTHPSHQARIKVLETRIAEIKQRPAREPAKAKSCELL